MTGQPKDKFEHLRLVPQEQEQKPLLLQEDLRQDICVAIASGQVTVIEDITSQFGIPYEQVLTLLNDPTFLSSIRKFTNAKLQLTFNTLIPKKLDEIIRTGDNKESMSAMKLAAQLTDNLKNTGTDVNVNLNLEGLVRETEKNVTFPIDTEFRKVG